MDRKKISDKRQEIFTPDVTFHAEIIKSEHDEDDKKDNDDFFIEGFASTENIDRVNDIVLASAFKKSLKQFMKNPVLLFQHGFEFTQGRNPIGKIVEAEIIEGKGLKVKAFISKTETELREKIREGILRAFSFGFKILDSAMEKVKGKDILKITGLELLEISVVSIPANRQALFSVAKAFELGSDLIYKNEFVEDLNTKVDQLVGDVKVLKEIKSFKSRFNTGVNELSENEIEENEVAVETKIKTLKDIIAEKQNNIDLSNKILVEQVIQISQLEELKAGKVLSSKNKAAITKAVEAMQTASTALSEVLDLSSTDEVDTPKPKKEIDSDDIKDHEDNEMINEALDGVFDSLAALN